jgi:REP-associated tyrosine transposase
MPRQRRVSPDGYVQHVINRGDHRETIFHKPADFRAFLAIIAEVAYKIPMRILAYCIMRNHFHLLLWPYKGSDLPDFMQVVMNTHIRRYILHYRPAAPGHIYQGRYHNPLVETSQSLTHVAKYIEANPKSAGLVRRVEHYRWSSASPHANDSGRPVLAEWPIERPANWLEYVNSPTPSDELTRIHRSIRRGSPYGSDEWIKAVAAAHRLERTLRDPGRPRVYETLLPTE